MSGQLIRGVKNALPYIVKSSKGHIVKTQCGKELLDLTCGIGVTNLGHSHPKVTAAAQSACENLVHAQQNIMRHEPMMQVIDNLASTKLAKSAGLDAWFLWNGGSDAVEAAIKIARMATGKQNIITMNLGYHGRTFLTMGLTASGTIYRSGFGPLPSGIFPAPFPYVSRSPLANANHSSCLDCSCKGDDKFSAEKCAYWGCEAQELANAEVSRCLRELELILRTQTSPTETACILIEPVLGEGGYVPPPPGYLQGVRKICDKHNILLIIDEVQTGFGRTGTMFASEWLDIKPDIIVCAKGLANGFPLSAVGTRKDIADHQPPGSMGGTYGGNAVACAAANAVFAAIKDENILENSMIRSVEARQHLSKIANKFPGLIKEVRGRGLMLGIEFNTSSAANYSISIPSQSQSKDDKSMTFFKTGIFSYGAFAGKVATKCWEMGLLILTCGPYDVIRIIPPLNITSKDLKTCMDILENAVTDVVNENTQHIHK